MKLWCYGVDKGNWGQSIAHAAKLRGIDASVFHNLSDNIKAGDYVFMRIPQWEPECSFAKKIAGELSKRGCIMIPDMETIWCYEDKVMQSRLYGEWLPKTFVLDKQDSWEEAEAIADILGYPFLSKSKEASASANVRIIRTKQEANNEFDKAMTTGIDIKVGKGRIDKQIGYLIWQRFCPNNQSDYRVVITGRHMMMLQRDNKPGTPFASGSGVNRPVNEIGPKEKAVLDKARAFFDKFDLRWNGIDLVYDSADQDWKVLETTLGWSQSAYQDCQYFGTHYKGEDMFELFVNELQQGVFDG